MEEGVAAYNTEQVIKETFPGLPDGMQIPISSSPSSAYYVDLSNVGLFTGIGSFLKTGGELTTSAIGDADLVYSDYKDAVSLFGLGGTPVSSQLPVGGVLLDKAATLVGANLSDITGAMYDPVSGQFVILGTNNPAPVKGINLDYLYTALQAVYGSAVPPFVTLVPSAIITAFYTYDERNLMTGYSDATNQILYTYNGDAQRMSSILNGAQTSYVIDPNRSVYEVVQERNGSGTITASYTFGTTRLATWNGSAVTFELNDRLGSVRLVTDANGNVLQTNNYDALGASR